MIYSNIYGRNNDEDSIYDENPAMKYATNHIIKDTNETENLEVYKAMTESGAVVEKLLDLIDESGQFSIQDYIFYILPGMVNLDEMPKEIKSVYPFYKRCLSYFIKKGVSINIVPTTKISRDALLFELEKEDNTIKSITIFLTDSPSKNNPLNLDKIVTLLKLLLNSFVYRDIKYSKQIVMHAYYTQSPTPTVQCFGKESKRRDIMLSYLDDTKKDLIIHDSKYLICTCKCKTGEIPYTKCLHPTLFSQLKQLYKDIE